MKPLRPRKRSRGVSHKEILMADVIVLKTCTKCKRQLPATPEYFHRSKKFKDHLYPSCKDCKNAYGQTPSGKEVTRKKTKKRRQLHPEKARARYTVNHAVQSGKMPRPGNCVCMLCYGRAVAYHHHSYKREHRLEVIPLCRSCHDELHRMPLDKRRALEHQMLTLQPMLYPED